jgi:tetratricopeptide (TPR) repeat protein
MRRAALLAALGLAVPLAARGQIQGPAHRAPSSADPVLRQASETLAEEDLEATRAGLEPLLRARPSDPEVQRLGGILRFQEQRYAEAVELLERAGGASWGGIDWLRLARAAVEITRDHQRAESEHFLVSTPRGKDEVLAPYLLETLEAQRAALLEDLGWVPPGKVTVEILQGTRELSRLSTLTVEEIRTSGTIALCKFNKLMMVSPKALWKGYDWLDTAAHEYTHHVVTQRTKNNTPIWLQEGLAKWEESRWRGPGGQSFSPYAAALLRDAAQKDRLVTFEQMHPSMAKLPSQEAAALAFAEVMVAVEYLHAQGGPPLLRRILERVGGAIPVDRAIAEALGVSFEQFVAGWKRHLTARPLPTGGDTALRRLRFQEEPGQGQGEHAEWAEVPDERARALARLGEIMRERGRWAAARVELGRAMRRVGPRYPVLTAKFALAAMLSGHETEAEAALREAAQVHPHYAALHVGMGRLLLRRQDWAGARQAFLLANRVDPFDPEIHLGLARAAQEQGDAAMASREARFAQILSGRHTETMAR